VTQPTTGPTIGPATGPATEFAVSKDGTRIAYQVSGEGETLILVDGALCHRGSGPARSFTRTLSSRFAVHSYDRRGRGESGATPGNLVPEDLSGVVQKEIDDLAAVIDAAGGRAFLFGQSSGAALALAAAAQLPGVVRVAAYEAPFIIDDTAPPRAADEAEQLAALIAADQRGKALKRFFTSVGVPAPFRALMPLLPAWKKLTAVAHTLPYDLTLVSGDVTPERWASIAVPVLIMNGGKAPDWMRNSALALAQVVPGAQYREIPGQTHLLKAEAVEPALAEFFAASTTLGKDS
jgi:pimeloyl-ACP methyl ester carboxylesterase